MHPSHGTHSTTTLTTTPRVTSCGLQFLVDDLARSIAYYEKVGFTFGAGVARQIKAAIQGDS